MKASATGHHAKSKPCIINNRRYQSPQKPTKQREQKPVHFNYTVRLAEYRALLALGWRDEGTAFQGVASGVAGAVPVYREYNPNDGNHNWTRRRSEHDALVKLGWRDEGTAWWVPKDGASGSVPVYRLYNPYSGEHVYTTNAREYAQVGVAGWHREGVAWDGYPKA
ncbi:hypothetical protein [Bifidobacterium mongoliense]|nr:hypothetical protein [Bifidobacterium mongoliense]